MKGGVPSSWKSRGGPQDCKLELCPQGSFKSFCQTKPERKFQIFLPNKARERECFRMTGLERPSLSWDGRALDAHKMGCVGGGAEEMSDLSRFPSPLPPLPLSSSSSDIRRPCSTSVLCLASFLCNIGLNFYIGLVFFILASFSSLSKLSPHYCFLRHRLGYELTSHQPFVSKTAMKHFLCH